MNFAIIKGGKKGGKGKTAGAYPSGKTGKALPSKWTGSKKGNGAAGRNYKRRFRQKRLRVAGVMPEACSDSG